MYEELFLTGSALFFFVLIVSGWRYLPRERWQMLATVPVSRRDATNWRGVNLTMYGALTASAVVIGLCFALILAVSAGNSLQPVLIVLIILTGLCLGASRLVARKVEHKPYTFTIGGAFFCGLLAMPCVLFFVNCLCFLLQWPILNLPAMMAALAIGYVIGEGLGRLACLSFGCCYGKPLRQCGRLGQAIWGRIAVIFSGDTKKAVYEGQLAGEKLVPVQGMTSILLCCTGLCATSLFLKAQYPAAFLLCLTVSQCWRVFSETLRADYRGSQEFSAYQKMAILGVVFGWFLSLILSQVTPPTPEMGRGIALFHSLLLPYGQAAPPEIGRGLLVFQSPLLLLGLQSLWAVLFCRFGRSMVTSSTLSFQVVREHI